MVTEHRFASPQTNVTKQNKPGRTKALRLHTIAYRIGNCFQPRRYRYRSADPADSPRV